MPCESDAKSTNLVQSISEFFNGLLAVVATDPQYLDEVAPKLRPRGHFGSFLGLVLVILIPCLYMSFIRYKENDEVAYIARTAASSAQSRDRQTNAPRVDTLVAATSGATESKTNAPGLGTMAVGAGQSGGNQGGTQKVDSSEGRLVRIEYAGLPRSSSYPWWWVFVPNVAAPFVPALGSRDVSCAEAMGC